MDIKKTLSIIKYGAADLVSEDELRNKLRLGRSLRVKLGVDPTSPELHLGHTVVLNRLRAFQDLGHIAVLILGDFTARIGDPSGRDATRPVISAEIVRKNAETYTRQAFHVLDPSKTEIRFNSEWLMSFIEGKGGEMPQFLTSLSRITVSRLLEREDFKSRMAAGNPVSMLEFLYPVFQGYDSVAVNADVELGGSDQIFNLLVGRDIQKNHGQEPQVVMTFPLLIGTDGTRKMSKSYGNHIALIDTPQDMFGKVMSVSDELMMAYYGLLTSEDTAAVNAMHPMEAKKKLGSLLVSRFHGADSGETARSGFENVFSRRELPQDIPVFHAASGERISCLVFSAGLAPSMNEARRLIRQGAVKVDGKKVSEDVPLELPGERVLQVGRRQFCKLIPGK
ncbi:MAG: tyrosine--tRNA ligase [bacterium]